MPVSENGIVEISGNTSLELNGATFQASNSSVVELNTLDALVLNSHISNYNVGNFTLGNSSLTGAKRQLRIRKFLVP